MAENQVNSHPTAPSTAPFPRSAASAHLNTLQELIAPQRKIFFYLLGVGTLLGIGRFLFPFSSLSFSFFMEFAFSLLVFLTGVFIAPLTFLTEVRWKQLLEEKLSLRFPAQESPLRQGILFLILPILGIFVVSSSRAPLGLGFLWGISAWYALEAWQILQKNESLRTAYFPAHDYLDENTRYILWGFCIYAALLTFGILFI